MKKWLPAALLLSMFAGYFWWNNQRSKASLSRSSPFSTTVFTEPTEALPTDLKSGLEDIAANNRLANLWRLRANGNVAAAVAELLTRSMQRREALKILGRLDENRAESELSSYLNGSTSTGPVLYTGRVALARIRTRKLHGEARLDAFARELGFNWLQTKDLFVKANGPYQAIAAEESTVISEVVNILCEMAGRGENIELLMQDLRLKDGQKLQLNAAKLPPDQGALMIAQFLSKGGVRDAAAYDMAENLGDYGPAATPAIIATLKQISSDPKMYTHNEHYGLILSAAERSADPLLIPALRALKTSSRDAQFSYRLNSAAESIQEIIAQT